MSAHTRIALVITTLSSSFVSSFDGVNANAIAADTVLDKAVEQQFDVNGTPIIATTRHLRHPRETGAIDEQQQQLQSRELNHRPRKKRKKRRGGGGGGGQNRESRNSNNDSSTSSSFRLRLHWERGYYWQESNDEMFFCMECNNQCNAGDSILIEWCSSNANSNQYFINIDNTIRPLQDTGLCLTSTGNTEGNPIRVYRCDGGIEQRWDGFQYNGRPFELHPRRDINRCVGQLHHPKRQERVYPEECRLGRNDKTSLWITF